MIQGLHYTDIQPNDYYRRFVLLKLLLAKARGHSQSEEIDHTRRYAQITRDLQILEISLASKKNINTTKSQEVILRINEMHLQFEEIIPQVEEKKSAFEGQLLKRWRTILTLKKKNEEESKKKKDQKSTSNKNLMYLTSQLLKKQRISTHNLTHHQQKVEQIQKRTEIQIQQAHREFSEKHERLRQMIDNQQNRIKQMVQQYLDALDAEQQQYIEEAKKNIDILQQQLQKQRNLFSQNTKEINQPLMKGHGKPMIFNI